MKIDIVKFCLKHNLPFAEHGDHHHGREGWVQVHCPFCSTQEEGNFRLGYSVDFGTLNCWRCGKHSLYDYSRALRMRYNALQAFKQGKDISQAVKTRPAHAQTARKPPAMKPMAEKHKSYLSRRGYDAENLISTWNLQGTEFSICGWDWRIIAPIKDIDNQVVAYTGRAIKKKNKLRWKTSSVEETAANPKSLIYGIEKAKRNLLIVEGPSDVWRFGPGCVATLGIDWKIEQAIILKQFENKYILFDDEPQAQVQAKKLAIWLSAYHGNVEIISLDGLADDAGSLTQRDANEIKKELNIR